MNLLVGSTNILRFSSCSAVNTENKGRRGIRKHIITKKMGILYSDRFKLWSIIWPNLAGLLPKLLSILDKTMHEH